MTDHNRNEYRAHDWREADRLARSERFAKWLFFALLGGGGALMWWLW